MNIPYRPRGWRFHCTLLAFLVILAACFHPEAPLERSVYRFLFVLDITQSMNSRDVQFDGASLDRLTYTKEAIRSVLFDLPCGSEVGLGLFTTRNTEILFRPIEVCSHLPIIDDVLAHVDWRMAWAADSYIAEGLFSGLRQLRGHPADLVFFTDGQQTPDEAIQSHFSGKPGEQKGIIVGVGGPQPVMIPKLDRENRLIGHWEIGDLRTPVSTTDYQQARPEASEFPPKDRFYLSRLHEDRLQRLAGVTGLEYHRLSDFGGLRRALLAAPYAEPRRVTVDLSPLLAGTAGLLLLISFLSWPRPTLRRRRGIGRSPSSSRR